MNEIKPGVPDISEALTEEMRRLGLAPKMIGDFRKLWNQLLPHSKILPCPICFSTGYIGKLIVMPVDQYGNESVQCESCDVRLVVQRVN